MNQPRIFGFVRRTDRLFLYWNGLLLLFVTFMPFPTALLAEFLLLYLAVLALSFVSVDVSEGLCLCLAVLFAFKGWPTIHATEKA